MHDREPQLLVSKLSVPPWRPHWVRRPRLLPSAAQACGARLLLCSAPAGFGKTTALIAWADQCRAEGALVAWCTLDRADNDLVRFAAYLAGAFAQADPRLALAEVQRRAGADVEQLLVGLLNLLGASGGRYACVLDDYHLIQSPAAHQALALALEHLPANVQVALGTRADPPLPLARLRARGLLAELRAADLQFDPGEIETFFLQQGWPGLSAGALALLGSWAEGWAAGLQLLALALPHAPEGRAALEHIQPHIVGSQRHIFTFLADEVFAQQPPEVQAFLLATSVADHLTPELCDALVGVENSDTPFARSAHILERLEQAHLFLVRLDPARPWYRYHHLFSDFLRHRLEREQPGRRAALHRRAAGWYAAVGEVTRAVNHAIEAGDTAYAAELIARAAPQVIARGEVATLLAWAGRFSHAQLVSAPALCLYFGRAAYLSQHAARAERFFALAEQGLSAATPEAAQRDHIGATLIIARAAAASMDGSLGRAAAWLATAEPLLPPDAPAVLAAHASAAGVNHLLGGDLAGARAAFELMGAVARRSGHTYFAADAAQLLALLDLLAGRLTAAEARCAALLASFAGELPALPSLGLVLARLGAVAYHRGELERAEQLLRQGAQVGRRSLGRADRQIWPWLVRVAAARGDPAGLRALLAEDEGQRDPEGDAVLAGLCMAARAEGLLALGAVDEAWHWAQRCEQLSGEHLRDMETLAAARVLLARRRPEEALARLVRLVALTEGGGRVGHLIEGLVALAHALHDLRRPQESAAALRRALALGEPEGYVQVFIGVKGEGARPHPLIEPLTERELEVLRLLAEGATNQDIAAALVVTVGTVKSHLNHILGKLGARNRTEAVARARARGLL